MCWKHALSKMYAACVELDIRPNSLWSSILRYTVSLEKGGGLNPGSADKTLNMKIRHGRMGTTRSGACGLI